MDDSLLARVAVFGLRAGVKSQDLAIDRYYLLPGLRPYSEEELVQTLTNMPKPARCVGYEQQGALHIACWTGDQLQQDPVIQDLAEDARSTMEHLRDEYRRVPGTLRIGVVGMQPSVVLNDLQLERWMREYDLASVTVSIDDPAKGDKAGRIDAWLRFSAPEKGLASGHPQ